MNDDTTHERRAPLNREEREARKVFRQAEAVKAMNDHDKQQKAFNDNRERLKAERLEREAQAASSGSGQGIVLDEKAQEQPKDKKRAQQET